MRRKTVVLLADGFEEIEALTVVDVLRRLDIDCDLCSISGPKVVGAHGITVLADYRFEEMDFGDYEALILPGGMPGARNLKTDKRVTGLVSGFNNRKKLIAAICAAPIVLKESGITAGRTITSFPGYEEEFGDSNYVYDRVVRDSNIITSRGPGTAMDFAFRIAEDFADPDRITRLKHSMLVE